MGSNVITGAAFLLFVVGVLVYIVILYNELVRLRNDNDRAWANIDVLLKQRHDEIPNLVETVKGYMQHEQQTLVAVTQARAASMNAASIGQKAQADLTMTAALRSLFAVAENYPQLKARTASANWKSASPTGASSSTTTSTPTTPASVKSLRYFWPASWN
jgi:LemA protein